MEEVKDLYKISRRLYNGINDYKNNQDVYNVLSDFYESTKRLTLEDTRIVVKTTLDMIEEVCFKSNICPCCGNHLEYHATYEDDTNSYYNCYYYCNECYFRRDIVD